MGKVVSNVLVIVGLVAFLGGLPCLVWAAFFGGPNWAGLWGLFGLPVMFVCIQLAGEPTP